MVLLSLAERLLLLIDFERQCILPIPELPLQTLGRYCTPSNVPQGIITFQASKVPSCRDTRSWWKRTKTMRKELSGQPGSEYPSPGKSHSWCAMQKKKVPFPWCRERSFRGSWGTQDDLKSPWSPLFHTRQCRDLLLIQLWPTCLDFDRASRGLAVGAKSERLDWKTKNFDHEVLTICDFLKPLLRDAARFPVPRASFRLVFTCHNLNQDSLRSGSKGKLKKRHLPHTLMEIRIKHIHKHRQIMTNIQ